MAKKKITISESELREVISATIKNVLNETSEHYSMMDIDEIMEYMWLKPKNTGLKVDIFVDDGGSFERNNHSLLVFVRNGYNKADSEFIPISVSNSPIILDDTIDYKITYDDIFAVEDFIVANVALLEKLATRQISQMDFFKSIKIPQYAMVMEGKQLLTEMSTLRTEDTQLPVDIWVDENATYMGHAPRLKFRASHEQRTTREFSSMLLTNPPTIENFPKNSPIKKKDIEKIEKFVIENLGLLLDLANGKISFEDDFLPNFKKV